MSVLIVQWTLLNKHCVGSENNKWQLPSHFAIFFKIDERIEAHYLSRPVLSCHIDIHPTKKCNLLSEQASTQTHITVCTTFIRFLKNDIKKKLHILWIFFFETFYWFINSIHSTIEHCNTSRSHILSHSLRVIFLILPKSIV